MRTTAAKQACSQMQKPGVVYAVEIDDARHNKPAQFEQMMPVLAVAGQPRGINSEHSTDFPGAQSGNELLEAGAGYHAHITLSLPTTIQGLMEPHFLGALNRAARQTR